jgi:hypothetical protein
MVEMHQFWPDVEDFMARNERKPLFSLNVLNLGDEDEPMIHINVDRRKDPNCVLHSKVTGNVGWKYVIDAMADTDEGRSELGELAEAAFELGRKYQEKYGKPGKKVPRSS